MTYLLSFRFRFAVSCFVAALLLPLTAQEDESRFDLLIRRGQIVDGTGNPSFVGDVAVQGGRIVEVGRNIQGSAAKILDARGLVIAPGFIDIHSHSDWLLFEDGHAQSKIRQGVTTEVVGEGHSAAPYKGKLEPRAVVVKGKTEYIASLGDYLDAIDRSEISVNIASYVGLNNLWQGVMGYSFDQPTAKDIEKMKMLLAEAMEDGAFGLSSQLMTPPGLLATTDQIVELCSVVREYGGIYSSHIRNEGLGVFKAVKQAIEIGERGGVPVDIIHIKIADQQYWGRMDEVIELIESARKRGVNVQANVYPYTRGNNSLGSIIPPWAHEGGWDTMISRLKNKDDRERMKKDILNGVPGWYNHYTAVGSDWSRMLVSADNEYKGMTMDAVMEQRTQGKITKPDFLDELFDLIIEKNNSIGTVYAHHTEKDMNLVMTQSWCSIGSDGSAFATEGVLRRGNPHPRNFGTFPRVLGLYVRERNLLSLEEAVRKMTSLNAAKIGLRDRGLLKEGMFADITVFDADEVIDQAEFTDPFHYSKGIKYVLVNGELVLDDQRHTEAKPGRALRYQHTKSKHSSPFTEGIAPQFYGEIGSGEGPAWHPDGYLVFSGGGRIGRRDMDGTVTDFRNPSGGSNGLMFDAEGRLVVCEAKNRRVTRTEKDGGIVVLADQFQGSRFNTPNDLTLDSKGRIYFSDPRYGNRDNMEIKDKNGKPVEGVYRIDLDGSVSQIITHEVDRPNGVLVTPDDRYLYVAGNNNNTIGGERKLWRFDLKPDGTISPGSRKLVFDWKDGRGPDGMCMDLAGRLFVAGGLTKDHPPYETADEFKGGVYVFAQDRLIDFIAISKDEVTNCSFGGPDYSTLFITAGGTLWSIRSNTSGEVNYSTD